MISPILLTCIPVRGYAIEANLDSFPLGCQQTYVLPSYRKIVIADLRGVVYINTLLAMLNSRDILHGRGVNEEESAISTRKINPGLSSSSQGTRSGAPVRFNVTDSKVQSFNIEVTQTVDISSDDADKVRYEEDDISSVGVPENLVDLQRLTVVNSTTTFAKAMRSHQRVFKFNYIWRLPTRVYHLFAGLSVGISSSLNLLLSLSYPLHCSEISRNLQLLNV